MCRLGSDPKRHICKAVCSFTVLWSPSTPICQGGQVANLWQPLHDTGIHIDFSHNAFPWDNEVMYVSFGV